MQQTQIIPHIRAISYGFTFSSKSWSHGKPKFYYIFNLLETQIIPHFRVTIFLFSLRILITCQTQILLHFQFARNPNYTTFSNHYQDSERKKKNSDSKMWYNLGFEQIEDVVKFGFVMWSRFRGESKAIWNGSNMWYNLGLLHMPSHDEISFT